MARSGTRTVVSIIGNQPIAKLPAYLVDIDGTVALHSPDARGWFEFEKAGNDLPNRPVVDIVNMLAEYSGARIIFITGREERFREITENWLNRFFPIYDLLYMRSTRDVSADWYIKNRIYEKSIEPTFDVKGVFDDRQQVVDMWRALGLTCFQVAPGDF